jgi:hypothetical protein
MIVECERSLRLRRRGGGKKTEQGHDEDESRNHGDTINLGQVLQVLQVLKVLKVLRFYRFVTAGGTCCQADRRVAISLRNSR